MVDFRYSDLDLDFVAHPVKKDITLKYDREAVRRSVRYLILTRFTEKPFDPAYGCGVYNMLFDPVSKFTAGDIEHFIREAIQNYEPRAILEEIEINIDEENQAYDITIRFHTINILETTELNLILHRVR